MWGGSVYHNPLGPPVNLCTTGTVGWQFVLSVHYVKFVSLTSSVSLSVSPSLWAEMSSSSDECASYSDFNTSSVMSQSVRFFLVAMLPNALPQNLAHNKPNTLRLWLWFKHLYCLACQMLLLWHGTDCSAELQTDRSMILQFKKDHKEFLIADWRTFVSGPILHWGACGGAVGWGTALQTGRLRFWFPMVSMELLFEIILLVHYGPGVDSASNRNEYQEYFMRVKAVGA